MLQYHSYQVLGCQGESGARLFWARDIYTSVVGVPSQERIATTTPLVCNVRVCQVLPHQVKIGFN